MRRVAVLLGRAAWVALLLPMPALADGADSGRAADPGAAAAPLLLDDPLRGYRPLDGAPLPWTRLFDAEGNFRASEALREEAANATMQRMPEPPGPEPRRSEPRRDARHPLNGKLAP